MRAGVRASGPAQSAGCLAHFAITAPLCSSKSFAAGTKVCSKINARQLRRADRSILRINALDAAMPFDYEARAARRLASEGKLTVGIVGFGTFGQFLARRMVKAGHTVLATSRTPYGDVAASMGVAFFQDVDDFCEQHPDVVILATSILSLEQVLGSLPFPRLRRNTLIVDVLSVKEFPKRLLLAKLPPEVDILCTHPMFGPDSGRDSWDGLNFMYEKVRVGKSSGRTERCNIFLDFFANEGCKMVEMSCEEHDRAAASTQFITHTVGRMLGAMELGKTPIDTRGYQSLLSLVENTANDSFDLYYGLFLYNGNATQELERLEKAFDQVKRQLLSNLHEKLRGQLFPMPEEGNVAAPTSGGGDGSEATASGAKNGSNTSSSVKTHGSGNGNGAEVAKNGAAEASL